MTIFPFGLLNTLTLDYLGKRISLLTEKQSLNVVILEGIVSIYYYSSFISWNECNWGYNSGIWIYDSYILNLERIDTWGIYSFLLCFDVRLIRLCFMFFGNPIYWPFVCLFTEPSSDKYSSWIWKVLSILASDWSLLAYTFLLLLSFDLEAEFLDDSNLTLEDWEEELNLTMLFWSP